MFGFSWAEIGLIMAVALIAIGPKDLPVAIRTVTAMMKKARGMAAEFQGHVDEMMRDANLSDVKQEIDKLRRFDFKSAAENAIDPDGALRDSVARPFDMPSMAAAPVAAAAAAGSEPAAELASVYEMGEGAGPSFVPPPVVAEVTAEAPAFIPPDAARKPPVPDFIPPGTKRWGY
ncbi:Sec-independent protein translocase protein TatB [Acidocella sp.]|jgi:sec-independent protein translocase protein TatB|uniref:Sec-independent protein translocase protein TatB n=1 Tax=Acidocella sp. TaxID=50710 RepID=UPI002F40320F